MTNNSKGSAENDDKTNILTCAVLSKSMVRTAYCKGK